MKILFGNNFKNIEDLYGKSTNYVDNHLQGDLIIDSSTINPLKISQDSSKFSLKTNSYFNNDGASNDSWDPCGIIFPLNEK
jgi:hypothetical protein